MNKKITASLIALMMIICSITLVACGKNDTASDDPNLGIWNATTGEMMGISMGVTDFFGEGFSIELKSGGKCKLTVDGEKANGKWTLENGAFTVKGGGIDCAGTLENGKIILDDVLGRGLTLIFEKEGGPPAGTTGSSTSAGTSNSGTPAGTTNSASSDVDYFVISSMTESGQTFNKTELAAIGLDSFYVLMHKDGKFEMMAIESLTGTWKDGKIDLGEQGGVIEYTLKGDELTIDFGEGVVTVYTRSKDAPPAR